MTFLTAGTFTDDERKYIGVKLSPPSTTSRSTFHLVLLIDVSGSMEGSRIQSVQRTLKLLIDQMTDGDKLTLISYENNGCVLANAITLSPESRSTLHTAVDALQIGGGTNLGEGLMALREIANYDAIFLLTDGQINQGITSTSALLGMLSRVVPQSVAVNTLGYGDDHNIRLLKDMAMMTCGTYTYADAAEMIPAIIGDIVGGLANTVGKNAKVSIPTGWSCSELVAPVNNEYTVGSLISDKPQWIVLEAALGADPPQAIHVTWTSLTGDQHDELNVFNTINEVEVASQRDRCAVAKAFSQISQYVERSVFTEAHRVLQATKATLERSPAKDTLLGIQLIAQVQDMIATLPTEAPSWGFGGMGAGGSIGGIVSRLVSNTTALGNQRGFLTTSMTSNDPLPPHGDLRTPSALHATFSTPAQQQQTQTLSSRYTGTEENPAPSQNEDGEAS